jgi:hypothetical protein
MATEQELERLGIDLRKLVAEASKHEDLSTPSDMQGFIERVLTQSGYVCRNGVWLAANN